MKSSAKSVLVVRALRNLLRDVCTEAGLSPEYLVKKDNRPSIVRIRRKFAVQAREQGYSLPEIGQALKRHHTTVLNLLKAKANFEERTL